MGAKVQWMPTARASRAATVWARSMPAGSQLAASAIGTGKIVRSPWMTSNPNSAGTPSRLSSTASRWRRLICAGSVTKSSDPASPRPSTASTADGSDDTPPTLVSGSASSPK
jgi:hypothetical protein